MTDNPNKRHVDGWFLSSQPHEIDYFIGSVIAETGKSKDAVSEALLACRKLLSPSEGREKLKQCVKRRLS